MSLKQLQLHKNPTAFTTNDKSYCLCIRNTFDFLKPLKSHFKKTNQSNIMQIKFLLLYTIIMIVFNPIILCVQHNEISTSTLSQVTPSTNSINIIPAMNDKSADSYDYEDEEQSEEDKRDYTPSMIDVKNAYDSQFKAFANNFPKNENKRIHITTVKPRMIVETGSCKSSVCQARQDIENASTESIRKHILMKLGMKHEPNMTNYPKLTEEYREILCKRVNIDPEKCLGNKPSSLEYQSDDPIDSYYDEYGHDRDVVTEEEDVQFLSYENRIYAFPSTSIRPRHKSHLIFQFSESQEMNNLVAQATLNLFVRSRTYMRLHDMQLPKNLKYIDIEISKVLYNSHHKIAFETFHNISVPDKENDGEFVPLNITEMVAEWFSSQETSHAMAIRVIGSTTGNVLQHRIVSINDQNFATRPFIDILPRDQRKKRTKRSSLKCSKGSNESRCCRHELTVDFDKFGWDWIIAPKKYDANYCSGECKIAFMQQYAHTHVMQLSTAANPCCSPRKMTPMQLLYFDSQLNIVLGTIPNMIVEECFCS